MTWYYVDGGGSIRIPPEHRLVFEYSAREACLAAWVNLRPVPPADPSIAISAYALRDCDDDACVDGLDIRDGALTRGRR